MKIEETPKQVCVCWGKGDKGRFHLQLRLQVTFKG